MVGMNQGKTDITHAVNTPLNSAKFKEKQMKLEKLLQDVSGLDNEELNDLPDLYLEEINNHFYEHMSIEHSEMGATMEYEYDFDDYTSQYELIDMVEYLKGYVWGNDKITTSNSSKALRRSALTLHLLNQDFRYIMCEVADDDSDFDWMDSLDIVIITGYKRGHIGNTIFLDVNGNEHKSAQPIDGMGYVIEIEGEHQ